MYFVLSLRLLLIVLLIIIFGLLSCIAAAQQSTQKTKPTVKRSKQPIVVVIDPGHGGKDSGAVGKAGHREKDVALAIAKQLQRQFNQQPGFHAVLTRSRDTYLPLRERLAIARRYKPKLFLAIHADAAYNNTAVGASVFALSERGATSEMVRWLAKKENQSELIDGVFIEQKDRLLRSVLLDLSQNHAIAVSLELGQLILTELAPITHLHYRRVEQAGFVVLKSPDIPSLLVETGYISNLRQERQLVDINYQRRLAAAIVQGTKRYYQMCP